jgi:hypothetical protein
MSAKRTAVYLILLFAVAAAALSAYWVLNVWLPKRVGEAVTARFGEYVTIGEVKYVFPLGVEVRDVSFVRRPGMILGGEAARVRVKLRPLSVLLFRFDGRILQEVATDDFTMYLYPLTLPGPRFRSPFGGPAEAATGSFAEPFAPRRATPPAEPAPPASKLVAEGEKAPPPEARVAKAAKFDFTFRATGGRVVFRGDAGDTPIFRDVNVDGRVSDRRLDGALSAKTTRGKSFEFSLEHSFVTKVGSAEYRVEAVEAVHVLPWAGKPGYLVEAEGTLTFTGKLTWKGGKLDHVATGRLSHGRLVLAPDNVRISLEDVNLQFTLHNAELTVDEGSCRAAEAHWDFGGRVSKLAIDVTFRSEDMTLQNLADMIVGGRVRLSYAGVGAAELRIFGTPREPQFYLHVERTDK